MHALGTGIDAHAAIIKSALRVVGVGSRLARTAATRLARIELALIARLGKGCAACGETSKSTLCEPCADWIGTA